MNQNRMIQVKLKRGVKGPLKKQCMQMLKNELGLENSAVDAYLSEVERKRDEYCEASAKGTEQELEGKVMYYLKGSLVLNRLLRLNGLANCEAFSLEWKDTMANKTVKVTTSNEEVLNALYEFTVIKLKLGEQLLFDPESTEEQMKDGLQKLRNALWSMTEMRSTGKANTQFSDCESGFWSVMELYIIVLCYAGLYSIHGGEAKMSYGQRQVVAGLAEQARQATSSAIEQLLKVKESKEKVGQSEWMTLVEKNCRLLCAYFETQAFYSMGLYHEEMVETEPSKGHFGYAIAYTQASLEPQFKQNSLSFLTTKITPASIQARLENMVKRNQQIYKDKVPSKQDLKCFDLQNEMKIESKQPGLFNSMIELQMEQILGEQIGQEYQGMVKFVSSQVEKVKASYQSLIELQRNQYQECHVGYLLTISGGDSKESKGIQQKVQDFKQKCQKMDLQQGVENLQALSKQTQQRLNDLATMLDAEMAQDFQLKQQYKEAWNRMSSYESHKEYRQIIEKIGAKYRIAVNVDQPIYPKFNQHKQMYQQLKQNPDMLNQKASHSIKTQYRDHLNNVIQLDAEIEENKNQMLGLLKGIEHYLQETKVYSLVSNAVNQGLTGKSITDQVFTKLKAQVADYNQFNEATCEQIMNLSHVGQNVHAQIKASQGVNANSQQNDQNLINSLQVFIDIFNQLDQGMYFYTSAIQALTEHHLKVSDFVVARAMEANNLQSLIANQATYYKKNKK